MISLFLLTLPRYNHSRYIIKLFNVCLTTTLRYNHSRLQKSGVITFVAQLVQILMFKLANRAYPIIGGPVVMLYVRDFTVNC